MAMVGSSAAFALSPALRGAPAAPGAPQQQSARAPQDAAPSSSLNAQTLATAGAAALAVGAAASRRATRAPRVARLGGGVEGVRIVKPGSESGLLHQVLDGVRKFKLTDGVMKVSFMVPAKFTGSKEEFEKGRGTTENVYVLYPKGGSPDAGSLTMIDVPEARFLETFMKEFEPYFSRLEGLVLTHVGEENSETMLELCKKVEEAKGSPLKIYLSEDGKQIFSNYVGDVQVEKLDVSLIDDDSFIPCRGEGRLDAVCTSTGKYPDLMNVFDEATGILFSGKFFAAHSAYDLPSEDFDPSWDELSEDWHHYFDCNFFTAAAQEGVRRIFQITADNADDGVGLMNPDVERLAPYHGPVVTNESWRLMAKYEAWLERKMAVVNEGSAVVMYATAYSNTFKMAEAVAAGLESSGVTVDLMNVEFTDAKEIKKKVEQCDGFAIGSPTLGGQMPIQVKEALGIVLKSAQGGGKSGGSTRAVSAGAEKPCGAFGSFGWSGEAPEEVNQRLKDGGFSISFDPIRCKFTPTKQMLDQCEAAGARLAQSITKAKDAQKQAMLDAEKNAGKEKLAAKSDAEMAAEESLLAAFGNIINSSCMLTFKPAKEGEEGIRVPVSWVSQASFTPPGLMIAIEKRGLDAWLTQSPEEQLTELFKKYDKDGGGELDREEIDPLLTEMLGAEVGSTQEEMMKQKKEDAWKVLDIDGGGTVDMEEFIQAASEGPFAEMLDRERKMASLESIMGDDEDGALEFSLCMLPEGMKLEDAQKAAQHKKKKSKNGCTVIDGCTSFVECKVKSLVSAGTSSIIYAEVIQGDLVDESLRTELVRADHSAVEQVEGAEAAAAEETVAA